MYYFKFIPPPSCEIHYKILILCKIVVSDYGRYQKPGLERKIDHVDTHSVYPVHRDVGLDL